MEEKENRARKLEGGLGRSKEKLINELNVRMQDEREAVKGENKSTTQRKKRKKKLPPNQIKKTGERESKKAETRPNTPRGN